MKRLLCCLALVTILRQVGLGQAQTAVSPEHDGQPGCRIRYEFSRLWRNNFQSEFYWRCERWQVPASLIGCPSGTLFQDSWQTCVPFHSWEWTPYSEPPTRPGCGPVEECDELVTLPPDECKPTTNVTEFPPTTDTPVTTESPIITTIETTTPTEITTPTSTTPDPSCPCVTTTTTTTTASPTTPEPCPCPTTTTPITTETTTVPTTPPTTQPTTTTTEVNPCPCEETTTTTAAPCPCLTTPTTTERTTIGTIPLETSTNEATTATTESNPGTMECVGASAEQHVSIGNEECLSPPVQECTISWLNNRLPSRNPYVYFECTRFQGWVARSCLANMCYSPLRSTCVIPRQWHNYCRA